MDNHHSRGYYRNDNRYQSQTYSDRYGDRSRPLQSETDSDRYRSRPARNETDSDRYRSRPARNEYNSDRYRSRPARNETDSDRYRSRPARNESNSDRYKSRPARNKSNSDRYRSRSARNEINSDSHRSRPVRNEIDSGTHWYGSVKNETDSNSHNYEPARNEIDSDRSLNSNRHRSRSSRYGSDVRFMKEDRHQSQSLKLETSFECMNEDGQQSQTSRSENNVDRFMNGYRHLSQSFKLETAVECMNADGQQSQTSRSENNFDRFNDENKHLPQSFSSESDFNRCIRDYTLEMNTDRQTTEQEEACNKYFTNKGCIKSMQMKTGYSNEESLNVDCRESLQINLDSDNFMLQPKITNDKPVGSQIENKVNLSLIELLRQLLEPYVPQDIINDSMQYIRMRGIGFICKPCKCRIRVGTSSKLMAGKFRSHFNGYKHKKNVNKWMEKKKTKSVLEETKSLFEENNLMTSDIDDILQIKDSAPEIKDFDLEEEAGFQSERYGKQTNTVPGFEYLKQMTYSHRQIPQILNNRFFNKTDKSFMCTLCSVKLPFNKSISAYIQHFRRRHHIHAQKLSVMLIRNINQDKKGRKAEEN